MVGHADASEFSVMLAPKKLALHLYVVPKICAWLGRAAPRAVTCWSHHHQSRPYPITTELYAGTRQKVHAPRMMLPSVFIFKGRIEYDGTYQGVIIRKYYFIFTFIKYVTSIIYTRSLLRCTILPYTTIPKWLVCNKKIYSDDWN
jgi:hypothetical protein